MRADHGESEGRASSAEGRACGGCREEAALARDGERGPGPGQVTRASKPRQRFGLGQSRTAENAEAHLVIEKMGQVMTERSLAGSHDDGNGWWPCGPYALG